MSHEDVDNKTKAYERVVGATLGERYDILDVVSSGGAGDVYKVRHREMNKLFAAKVMRNEQTQDSIKRFRREAQMLCKLRHPNIVAVHSFGIDDKFGPYLIMDLLEGVDLHSLVKESGPLPLERAGKLLIGICDGMSNAHQFGIVHRDIKPSNVMVVGNGDEQRAVIIDFGAGKWIDSEAQQKLTRTTAVVGTPMYMAPEQCMAQGIDKRTDVYAMGCLMYEVLTGKPPFDGDSSFEIMQKHLAEIPAPPSVANPAAMIPSQIDQVVTMALQKQVDRRVDTFSKIKEALELGMQRPTYAKMFNAGIAPSRSVAMPPRKVIAVALAFCASVLVAGVLVFSTTHQHESVQGRFEGTKSFSELREEYNKLVTDGLTDDAINFGTKLMQHRDFSLQSKPNQGMIMLSIASLELKRGRDDEATHLAMQARPLLDRNIFNLSQFEFLMARLFLKDRQPKLAEAELLQLEQFDKLQELPENVQWQYDYLRAEVARDLGQISVAENWAHKAHENADGNLDRIGSLRMLTQILRMQKDPLKQREADEYDNLLRKAHSITH